MSNATKIRIVFNDYNVDAFLATSMIINAITDSNNGEMVYSIETVPHSLMNYVAPNKQTDFTFCIGVNMEMHDILTEAEKATNFFYIAYDKYVQNEDIVNKLKLKEGALIFTSDHMWGEELEEAEKRYSKNLCKLTQQLLTKYFAIPSQEQTTDTLKDLINAVEKYCNFYDITAKELALVHQNIDIITDSAFNGKYGFYKPLVENIEIKHNTTRTTKARAIISKGMAKHTYGNQKVSMMVPTLNCSEDYLYDLIRLISYPFETMLLYQDIKHLRQWWIYSSDPAKASKLAEIIPYQSKHQDGKIIYLVTETPRLQEK